MKKLLSVLPLVVLLCSCLSTQTSKTPPVPPEPDLNPMHASLGAMPNLVIAPEPKFCTNVLHWMWSAPNAPGLTSYNFYYGTNSGSYFKPLILGGDTNFYMTNIDEIVSTNPFVKITTYPDGTVQTNCHRIFVVVTALYNLAVWQAGTGESYTGNAVINNGIVESDYSAEALWPPLPPPPWSAVVISWPSNRVVTVVVGNIATPRTNWTTIPNPNGTNSLLLPLLQNSTYFQGITTDLPPVQLQIRGGYINGTN